MLEQSSYERMASLLKQNPASQLVKNLATELRAELNPHPAGQMDLNVPSLNNETLKGIQHKYKETVLFFPSQGQVCHSYCTFCFRWAQFVGDKNLRFASHELDQLHTYLKLHTDVSDILFTGIGTKALTFWPYRFVTDEDADELLRLLEQLVKSGKHVAIMAHYNHWRELEPPIAHEAIRRIRNTGAEIRTQGPLLAHINDDHKVWARLWREQVKLGIIPYYMFVERDTGACNYFEVPLAQAWEVSHQAIQKVSGLGRTARGPSMSAAPDKVEIAK